VLPVGMEAGWVSELVWTQRLEEGSFSSAALPRFIVLLSLLRMCFGSIMLPKSNIINSKVREKGKIQFSKVTA
jgi:hypothetical protein